jgi:membrane-associated HD superfamily phosphohydrolase
MEEIDLKYPQRFKKVLPLFKHNSFATRKEIETAHQFLDALAAIKQYSSADEEDMMKLEDKIIRLSNETKYDVNKLAETFLLCITIGYLEFP